MPQIGWFEILIIVAIAIIVIGPKDFPFVLKKIGSWIGKIKNYINKFQQELSILDNENIDVDINDAKKATLKYVKKVSCKAVNINLLSMLSSFTAWAKGSTKNPYIYSA